MFQINQIWRHIFWMLKDTGLYLTGCHLCCKNFKMVDTRRWMGTNKRTLGFIDNVWTCHQALLFPGRSSMVTLEGSLISSCQSENTIIIRFTVLHFKNNCFFSTLFLPSIWFNFLSALQIGVLILIVLPRNRTWVDPQ